MGTQKQVKLLSATMVDGNITTKRKRRKKEYNVICLNEPQPGQLERALSSVYARAINNGTLSIEC